MHAFLEQLLAAGPVVTDGARGTQLQARGLAVGTCPDAWNLDRPHDVEAVARGYIEAGSQVILTNTFGANSFILSRHNLADRVEEINRAGVELSQRAARAKGVKGDSPIFSDTTIGTVPAAKVFASMGPSGVMLMMGETTEDELRAAFAQQARAVVDAGADGIVVETMCDPAEACLAVSAAKETGLPVVACMTFDSGVARDRTMMGATPEQAAEQLLDAGADLVGSNCGQGIAGTVEICRRLHSASGRAVWVKANAGLPEMRDGKTHYAQTPEQFAACVPHLVAAGAGFIGGCCGTSPEFIRAVCNALTSTTR